MNLYDTKICSEGGRGRTDFIKRAKIIKTVWKLLRT